MKKILILMQVIACTILLVSCSKEEENYLDSLCAIEYSDKLLYIDGNYHNFIENLTEEDWDKRLDFNWWRVFFQFEDLYPLLREEHFSHNVLVNYKTLLEDLQIAKDSNGPIEFESLITIQYGKGIKRCKREIKVLYYNLYETYQNEYGLLTKYDYTIDIAADGYYSVSQVINNKTERFIANVLDKEHYTDGDIVIDVQRKYLGFDFIYYKNDEVIMKYHFYDYSKYAYYETALGMLHTDEEDVRYLEYISDNYVVVTEVPYYAKTIEFMFSKDLKRTFVKHELEVGKEYIDTTIAGTTITYTLFDETLLIISYETEDKISIYRILLTREIYDEVNNR